MKRSLLVEKDGGPLAVVTAGANVPDHKLLGATIEDGHRTARAGASVAAALERTLAWLPECRGIPVGCDKKARNYLGLLKLACALLWFHRLYRLAAARTHS